MVSYEAGINELVRVIQNVFVQLGEQWQSEGQTFRHCRGQKTSVEKRKSQSRVTKRIDMIVSDALRGLRMRFVVVFLLGSVLKEMTEDTHQRNAAHPTPQGRDRGSLRGDRDDRQAIRS